MNQLAADVLRKAIADSGLSGVQIAKATGIPQTTISDFIRGADLGIGRASILAKFLGLELRPAEEPTKPAAKRRRKKS